MQHFAYLIYTQSQHTPGHQSRNMSRSDTYCLIESHTKTFTQKHSNKAYAPTIFVPILKYYVVLCQIYHLQVLNACTTAPHGYNNNLCSGTMALHTLRMSVDKTPNTPLADKINFLVTLHTYVRRLAAKYST